MEMEFYRLIVTVLGGTKKGIEIMTGAKIFKDEKNNLIISNIKTSKKIKNIYVTYNEPLDLIDITYMNSNGGVIKTVKEIFIDQVKENIEFETGICFSLY